MIPSSLSCIYIIAMDTINTNYINCLFPCFPLIGWSMRCLGMFKKWSELHFLSIKELVTENRLWYYVDSKSSSAKGKLWGVLSEHLKKTVRNYFQSFALLFNFQTEHIYWKDKIIL